MQKKKILFITGTRADYGKLKSTMKAIEQNNFYDLYVFVCGMHLLKIFGSTYEEIIKDGYKNIYVAHGLSYSNQMSANLGSVISYLSGYISNIHPDMIVVHGDRIDALAGAIVGALNNIIVAHIEGGEITGTIDESIRHAVSKFAHLHFVANEDAKKRIIQLGEDINNIFIIGSPDIDIMLNGNLPSINEVKNRYKIKFDKYAIFIYHPVTTEHNEIGKKIKIITEAIQKSNKKFVVIYPNNDLGSEIILNEYTKLKNKNNFVIYPSMRFEHFLILLKNADFIIGNSSVGIRESGVYGIPTIDIGTRQKGRYKLDVFKNIQHVNESEHAILKAIDKIEKHRVVQMHFGNGNSTKKFVEIILKDNIWKKTLQKKFVDFNENT